MVALTNDGEYLEVVSSGIQVPTPELLDIIQGKGKGSLAYGSTYSGQSSHDDSLLCEAVS